ncbi:MAG: TonB-dependent receptor [Sphingomonadales bacterium]|nr:TonB-dependent receptor [Sphingomonadales bacterium]
MNQNIRRQSMLAATALAAVLASPALAQQAPANNASGDIIVTARRYEERLQDVPISVTVYNQEQLANRNIVTPADLATYTPSLTVNGRYGPEKSSFVIRGFVQEPSTSPSVGVYFADVVAPRAQRSTTSGNGAVAGQLFDLQNVQVLKGPQGTLFGRNTTGGAVLFVPQKPTDKLEGYVEASAGDYDMWRGQAVLNIPLSDTFKVRLGVDRNKRDGYMKNHSGVGPDSFNDLNYFAARASIVGDLTPTLENYTVATYTHSFTNGFAPRIGLCLTNGIFPGFTLSSGQARTAGAACAQIARAKARGDGPLDVDIGNANAFLDIEQWQVINTTTWQASDMLTIKNIVSYAEFTENSNFNLNGDNFFITNPPPTGVAASFVGLPFVQTGLGPTPGENNASQSGFTEELQFQGRAPGDRFVWQAGGYLEISDPLGWSSGYNPGFANCTNLAALQCITPFAGVGSISLLHTKTYWRNKAVYAQATYKLTDQLSFTGGIRYTWDKVLGVGESRRLFLATTSAGATRLACNDTRITADATNPANCHREYPQKSDRPTWLLDVDFKPTPDILLYAKWARGYRQGGVNLTNVGIETWNAEKVDTYEIGAKASFHGSRVSGYLNAAAFYNDFTNQQLVATLLAKPGTGLPGAAAVINAGKSKIQGVEVEGSLNAFDALRLDFGYTYLDTELKSFTPPDLTNTPFASVTPSALPGQPLALSPKHRLTATLTYTLPLDESMGKLSVGATYTYTSSQYATRADDFITPTVTTASVFGYNPGLLPATNLVNLNVNWNNVMGAPVDAAFFMTNVTNEIYPVNVGSGIGSAGFENFIMGPPRMWGMRLRYKFGE